MHCFCLMQARLPDTFHIVADITAWHGRPLGHVPACSWLRVSPSSGRQSLRDDLHRLHATASQTGDLVIRSAEAREFRAHRWVLFAQSPVMAAMLKHQMQETQTGVVIMDDVDHETMEQWLAYAYTGGCPGLVCTGPNIVLVNPLIYSGVVHSFCIPSTDDSQTTQHQTARLLLNVFRLADKYHIESLALQCLSSFEQHLAPRLQPDLALQVLRVAKLLSDSPHSQRLQKRAVEYVAGHLPAVMDLCVDLCAA